MTNTAWSSCTAVFEPGVPLTALLWVPLAARCGQSFDLFTLSQEEEDGSEDDGESKTQFTVTVQPDLSVLGFLDQMDEEVDGFISPVDELSPSKHTMDMRLSNLHSATM